MFYTLKEAGLPLNTSHDALRGHLHDALRASHGIPKDSWSSTGPWVRDTFPTHVVFSHDGQLYKQGYTSTPGGAGSDPKITLKGEKTKVHVAYSDNKEAAKESQVLFLDVPVAASVTSYTDGEADGQVRESIGFDAVLVQEGKKTSTVPVKLIAPGWGSMAYYSKEVLKRDGPTVFKKGTHMMWNHPTETQEADRPEGDLNDLAAVLMKDAEWQDEGPKGPGLYSEAKVFSDYSQQVDEKGAHIGISINAGIKCHEGTVEGRSGKIADRFVYAYSTDFVTKAGAGGAVVTESAHNHAMVPTKENSMTPEQITAMEARNTQLEKDNKTLNERFAAIEADNNSRAAFEAVEEVLKEGEIPFKVSLLKRACANPKMKEGKVDPDFLKGIIADFSEGHDGKVRGHGTTKESSKDDKEAEKALDDRLKESLKELGVPDAGMDIAMKGRA